MASATKLTLMEIYPHDWPVTLLQAAGLPGARQRAVPLSEIDHDETADHLTSIWVPAIDPLSLRNTRTPEGLRYIIERLRAPDGCPWDRKQTHATLLRYVLEEAAEVADAIEDVEDDPMHLAEELGDLLLQVYLHAEIAQQEDRFTLNDVFEQITTKMIRRHPHVFGTVEVSGAEQVVQNWEQIKLQERATTGDPVFESRLKKVPRNGSALANAHDIQRRAVKAGFDWPTIVDWLAKLTEEVREIEAAQTPAEKVDELGDILFTLVALARRMDIDAEAALRHANEKFRRRFMVMEQRSLERGLVLEEMDRDAQLELWRAAKETIG